MPAINNRIPHWDQDVFYDRLAHQIEREDGLVNTRLTWMLSTQGLLFAAFALIADSQVREEVYKYMSWLMPVLGALTSLSGFFGIQGANLALEMLKKSWDSQIITTPELRHPRFPCPFGKGNPSRLGGMPSKVLPIAFFLAWLTILSMNKIFIPYQNAKKATKEITPPNNIPKMVDTSGKKR